MRKPYFRHAETTVFGVTAAVLAGAVVWSAAASAEENNEAAVTEVVIAAPVEVIPEDVRLIQRYAARIEKADSVEEQLKQVKILKKEVQLELYEDRKLPLGDVELKNLLELVGFEGQALKTAWAIAKTESNGRPKAHNQNASTGDNSYGLFQINMIGSLGPDRLAKYNLEKNEDLFDPVTNATIAYKMSAGGTDFSAWKVRGYNQGSERFRNFLTEYPSKG